MSSVRRAFIAASIAWAALLVLTPYLTSRPHASTPGTALVLAVYGIGSLVCHQLAERSYRLWSAQMPVCARCTGIYFGAALSAIVAPFTQLISGCAWRSRSVVRARAWLAAAAAPTAATLVYEWTTGVTPSNTVRFAAGLPIGVAVVWAIVSATTDQVN
ncbi:MAG TPA: DUF2085 domain-containing protein [Vicinamibacterales bacterium]|nr:DUF2085 domain-containing protein [Vicinamibacterales bacterium]